MYKAVELGAKELGVTLSASDLNMVSAEFEQAAEENGGEEEYLQMLWEHIGCHSRDLFDYMTGIGILVQNIFTAMFGEGSELLLDTDIAEFTRDGGYLMVKHILRMKPEEGEDTALKESEEILALLNKYKGDDFGSYFDELMREHTEDSLEAYPNGYLFQEGDMVPSFYGASVALEIGEFSGIVESEYGYHILYRLPIDYNAIPCAYFFQNQYMTLRQIVANSLFDTSLYSWLNSLDVTFAPEFDNFDIEKVFKRQN
jgi:hypothetical protein